MLKNVERVIRRIDYKIFDFQLRNMVNVPPLSRAGTVKGLCLLSMACKRDFYQYLVAIYSFSAALNPEKIVVVNDGTLDARHVEILRQKIDGIEVVNGSDFITEGLPSYTSWQRLLAILSYLKDYYVVQLDADIIVRREIDEVASAVAKNHSFILGTNICGDIVSTDQAIANIKKLSSGAKDEHVQTVAEHNLDVLETIGLSKYVRGCAGFAGFAKDSIDLAGVRAISEAIESRLGPKWREWGSEQVTTNIITANAAQGFVLPIDEYNSSRHYSELIRLVHFIGPVRFKGYLYNREALRVMKDAMASGDQVSVGSSA